MSRTSSHGLQIAAVLHAFVEHEALPGTGIAPEAFWSGLAGIVHDMAPRNRVLLERRDALQAQVDAWHKQHRHAKPDQAAYEDFLRSIGYLLPEPAPFTVDTANVDAEIASIAGPQLVVPVSNARYALNAAKPAGAACMTRCTAPTRSTTRTVRSAAAASTHDAAPGSSPAPRPSCTRQRRWPRARMHPSPATWWQVVPCPPTLPAAPPAWRDPAAVRGLLRRRGSPTAVLLKRNGLHIEVVVDRAHAIGSGDPAGVADLVLESAISTIMDCEDSVAAVDAEDKVLVYRNWLGLMTAACPPASKGRQGGAAHLGGRRRFTAPDGGTLVLPGRSLMLFRNVGPPHVHRRGAGREWRRNPEGMLDAAVCAAIAMHDPGGTPQQPRRVGLRRQAQDARPKRSPRRELFGRVEQMLRPAACDGEDGHHGRGAADQRQPGRVHRRGQGAGGVHQHRLPRPHRGRDPYLHGGRARSSARTRSRTRLDQGVRGPQRPTSASPPGCAARRRSARACGPSRTGWRTCWRRRSATRRQAPTPPGCPPPRRHAARAALPPGERGGPAAGPAGVRSQRCRSC